LPLLGRRSGFEQVARLSNVLLADQDLSPAQKASTLLGGEVRSALAAIDPVGTEERADHIGLPLAPNDRETNDAGHDLSFAGTD
jgi:hypothetical protein